MQATPYFPPSKGGLEAYVLNLSLALSKLGHQVHVLTMDTENAVEEEWLQNVKVTRCRINLRQHRAVISMEFAKRIIGAKDYDLYHVHIPFHFGYELILVASKLHNIPLVVTYHGPHFSGGPIYNTVYSIYNAFSFYFETKLTKKMIFLSRSYLNSLGLPMKIKRKIIVLKPAVDIERFSPRNDGTKARLKHGFSNSHKVLLFVGSLGPTHRFKGIDYLIEAMKIVKDEAPSSRLVVVGRGERIPELRQIAKKLGLETHIIFSDMVSDEELPDYYAMCEMFVFPSYGDSFGLVVMEAMASGKPVVLCDVPGVGYNVRHGETGLKVPPKNPNALSDAIMYLLKNDELRLQMSLNARSEVESCSWEKVGSEIAKIYKNAMKQ